THDSEVPHDTTQHGLGEDHLQVCIRTSKEILLALQPQSDTAVDLLRSEGVHPVGEKVTGVGLGLQKPGHYYQFRNAYARRGRLHPDVICVLRWQRALLGVPPSLGSRLSSQVEKVFLHR